MRSVTDIKHDPSIEEFMDDRTISGLKTALAKMAAKKQVLQEEINERIRRKADIETARDGLLAQIRLIERGELPFTFNESPQRETVK